MLSSICNEAILSRIYIAMTDYVFTSRYFPTVYEPTVFENYVHGMSLHFNFTRKFYIASSTSDYQRIHANP